MRTNCNDRAKRNSPSLLNVWRPLQTHPAARSKRYHHIYLPNDRFRLFAWFLSSRLLEQWSPKKYWHFQTFYFQLPERCDTHCALPIILALHEICSSLTIFQTTEKLQQTIFYDQSMDVTWKVLDLTHTGTVGWFKFKQVHQKYPHFWTLCPRRECKEYITEQSLQSAPMFLQPNWTDYWRRFFSVSKNTAERRYK